MGSNSCSRAAALCSILAATLGTHVRARAEESPRAFVDENSVVIRDGAGEEVRIRHLSVSQLWPRQGDLVRLGALAYYSYHCYLMEVDPAARRVVRRATFPGRISALEQRESSLVVTVELPFGKAFTRAPFVYTPGSPPPTVLPTDDDAVQAPMLDAHRLLPHFDIRGTPEYKRAAAASAIQEGIYDAAFAANPTNPWFLFDKGVVLRHLERFDEARAAWRRAISVEGAPAFDYLRISALLAAMGEPAESDLAFERGYAEFVRSGLEPELVLSQEAFARYYAVRMPGPGGRTAHAEAVALARRAGDAERLIALSERAWRLAPRCERVGIGFAGLAEFLQERGRSDEAALWFARAREAARIEGPVGSRQAMYASVACLAALAVLLIAIAARALPHQRQALAPLGGLLASWRWPRERFGKLCLAYATRMEVAGLILVAASGFATAYFVVRGERAVLRSRGLPEEIKAGSWGHPNAVALFETDKTPAGKLLYGIARQQAGQPEKAEEVYKNLLGEEPRIASIAANNLGVMLKGQGEARFREAAERDPSLVEAKYNLGEPVDSPRTSRARKYRPEAKLMALPDAGVMAAAFSSVRLTEQVELESPAEQGGLRLFGVLTWASLVISAAVALVSLPFLAIKQRVARGPNAALGALGYVVPGTSPRLAPVGGLVLVAWLYCLLTLVLVIRGEYASVPASAQQAVERTFGLASGVVFPFESVIAVFGPVAFVGIWVLNGLALARAARAERARAAGGPVVIKREEPPRPVAPERPRESPVEPPRRPLAPEPPLGADFSTRETVRAVPESPGPPGPREVSPSGESAPAEKPAEEKLEEKEKLPPPEGLREGAGKVAEAGPGPEEERPEQKKRDDGPPPGP